MAYSNRLSINYYKWHDAKHTVRDDIVKKLSAAKQNLSIDKDIVAGIIKYSESEKTTGQSGCEAFFTSIL